MSKRRGRKNDSQEARRPGKEWSSKGVETMHALETLESFRVSLTNAARGTRRARESARKRAIEPELKRESEKPCANIC